MKPANISEASDEVYVLLHETVLGAFLESGDGTRMTSIASDVLIRMEVAYQGFRREHQLD